MDIYYAVEVTKQTYLRIFIVTSALSMSKWAGLTSKPFHYGSFTTKIAVLAHLNESILCRVNLSCKVITSLKIAIYLSKEREVKTGMNKA